MTLSFLLLGEIEITVPRRCVPAKSRYLTD